MSVAQILSKAETLGVRVSLDGDSVKLRGPSRAIAAIKPELAAQKSAIVEHLRGAKIDDSANIPADCIGALRDPSGGLYLPWAPRLSADDVRRLRSELLAVTKTLADIEHWTIELRDAVLERAIRGPLADLPPNIAYFRGRLEAARAEAAALRTLEARTWRLEGFDNRRRL